MFPPADFIAEIGTRGPDAVVGRSLLMIVGNEGCSKRGPPRGVKR